MTSMSNESKFNKYSLAAFFSGVGGIELGFTQTDKFTINYANEFDKNAQNTYRENFEDVHLDTRDIHEVRESDVPESEVIVGGFPCQAFSIAGYRKGFEDERGDLFFELLRIIKEREPRAIFIENVKNMVTHDEGNTFKVIREALTMNGYYIKWKVLNAKDYGNIPQNRERIYIVGFKSSQAFNEFKFPESIQLTTTLDDIIDFNNELDERYYYRKGKQPFYDILESEMLDSNFIYQWRRKYVRANKSGVVPTLTANMGTGGHNVPLIKTINGIRKLTPRETFNVQGFPTDFKLPSDMSHGQLYKQAGNSVVVPVIKRIADNIANALEHDILNYQLNINGYYSLIYTKMEGKFEGASYISVSFDSEEKLNQYIKENNITFITDDEYKQITKRKQTSEFYTLKYFK
ncbi:DNA cytosine methyltransferase [Staphylococcus pragensis]|uniref:Cytosine-specific methyltransferase n=2 Tax=Staphylococcus pragensis TaxID=1611836 RepID=A0A4Z1BF33_9STAP|nr:DNA cytosine methyltransferase [Staphylococcus carnosus]TGN27444.1 DNA cytosine methyltransferase [Staphylococcus pragensis]GGG92716.1 cytosine-specific methyltransferase [Staphylococcus pragensis]